MKPNEFKELSTCYLRKKDEMDSSFNTLLHEFKNNNNDDAITSAFNLCTKKTSDFSSEFELFLTNISSNDYHLSKVQVSDVLTSIENILEWFITVNEAFSVVSDKLAIPNILTSNNYFKTSQILLKSYRKDSAEKIMKRFIEKGISTEGFMSNQKMKFNTTKFDTPSVIAGFLLLAIGFVLTFLVGLQTGMQYYLVRIFIALGVGFLISGLGRSFISANFRFKGTVITSAGAAAVFLILYFINPAESPKYQPDSSKYQPNPDAPKGDR